MTEWKKLVSLKTIRGSKRSIPTAGSLKEFELGGGDNAFPHEYAVSGWFRWKPLKK